MRFSLIASLIALAACDVGEVPIGGNPGVDAGGSADSGVDPAASAAFMTMVNGPTMAAGCNKAGCHILQPPAFAAYTDFIRSEQYLVKTNNKIITGPGTLVGGVHPNGNAMAVPYLDQTAKDSIQMWLTMYGM